MRHPARRCHAVRARAAVPALRMLTPCATNACHIAALYPCILTYTGFPPKLKMRCTVGRRCCFQDAYRALPAVPTQRAFNFRDTAAQAGAPSEPPPHALQQAGKGRRRVSCSKPSSSMLMTQLLHSVNRRQWCHRDAMTSSSRGGGRTCHAQGRVLTRLPPVAGMPPVPLHCAAKPLAPGRALPPAQRLQLSIFHEMPAGMTEGQREGACSA